MTRAFAEQLTRDAAVFTAGGARGFGTVVVNGGAQAMGLLDTRYVDDDGGGFTVQKKVQILRLRTGEGGTIAVGTMLTIGGVSYRVDRLAPVPPDGLFTDYVVSGGAA